MKIEDIRPVKVDTGNALKVDKLYEVKVRDRNGEAIIIKQ